MALFRLGDFSPVLPDGAYWVAPTATVIGNVKLDADASIWFGAVLRGDNELIHIGARTNIQDNCVLHTDPGFPLTIGANCTIGHNVTLHGCTIGEGTLIGMGATIMNGTRIGKNCVIGANALISEGKEIPDNSLALGAPAKIIRTLTDEQAQATAGAAEIYVINAQRYRDGLEPA